jgi:hypothetical protein
LELISAGQTSAPGWFKTEKNLILQARPVSSQAKQGIGIDATTLMTAATRRGKCSPGSVTILPKPS